jgi:hypothetical protein
MHTHNPFDRPASHLGVIVELVLHSLRPLLGGVRPGSVPLLPAGPGVPNLEELVTVRVLPIDDLKRAKYRNPRHEAFPGRLLCIYIL